MDLLLGMAVEVVGDATGVQCWMVSEVWMASRWGFWHAIFKSYNFQALDLGLRGKKH